MKIHLMLALAMVLTCSACSAQSGNLAPHDLKLDNPEFDKTVHRYLSFSVPIISVDSLYNHYASYQVLDARAASEYDTSHLPGALRIGYKPIRYEILGKLDRSKPVVLYCSIGYRSEKVAEELRRQGFEVYNLYGSIFEWVNRALPVENNKGQKTLTVHGYNKKWSRWISNDSITITY